MIILSKQQIIFMHTELIRQTGGNKRIGAHAMLMFLALNGIELEYTQKELYTIILNVASDKCSFEELVSWITAHQV